MPSSNMHKSASILKSLVIDNWSLSNSPQVDFVWEEKTVGFMDDRQDSILLTPTNENMEYFGLYAADFYHAVNLRIDIYTYQNLEHHENMVNELFRILKANVRSTKYIVLTITGSYNENDSYRNIYRHVITVELRQINP